MDEQAVRGPAQQRAPETGRGTPAELPADVHGGGRDVVVEPLRTNDRATVLVGCVVWAVLLVLSLLGRDRLEQDGNGWWLWTCVAGLVLGLLGLCWLQVRHGRLVAQGRPPSRRPTG